MTGGLTSDAVSMAVAVDTERERMHFGQGLKQRREARGITLDDIAAATRISPRHLRALEEDDFAQLPGGVFNRGIARSYSRYVGLDEADTLRGLQDALRASGLETEPDAQELAAFAENVRRSRSTGQRGHKLRAAGAVAMVLGVLLLTLAVYAILVRRGVMTPLRSSTAIQHAQG